MKKLLTKRKTKQEEAVSPVVGVMLMLVVTIIIAAVVSAFAGGLATSVEKAPAAVLDIKIYSAADVGLGMSRTFAPDFTIDHLSGDTLKTSDLRLVFTWQNATTGDKYRSVYEEPREDADFSAFPGWSYDTSAMYLNDNDQTDGAADAWGTAVLTPGSHVQTGGNFLKQDWTNVLTVHRGSVFMDELMGTGEDIEQEYTRLADGTGAAAATTARGVMALLPAGTAVKVTIIYKPTGSAVYDKEVMVQ